MEIIRKLEQKAILRELSWDTEYFGVHSARVDLLEEINESEQDEIIEWSKQFDFVTIMNKGNLSGNNTWIGERTNAFLTDINVQFVKILEGEIKQVDLPYMISNGENEKDSLVEIARHSFCYSRFFNDPYLDESKSESIYVHWVLSAISDSAKRFVIAEELGKIIGFILFSVKKTDLTIELIAVLNDKKSSGVGSKMIKSLQTHIASQHIDQLNVGTQVDNIRAISFYINNGFQLRNCNSIYHLWNDKS